MKYSAKSPHIQAVTFSKNFAIFLFLPLNSAFSPLFMVSSEREMQSRFLFKLNLLLEES